MPTLIVYGIIALGILGILGGIGYKVRESGKDAIRIEWKEAEAAARKREADLSAFAAKALADERKKRKVVIQERTTYVDREVEKPVYRNVCLGDDGLRCINAAIIGKDAAGCKPDGTVPTAKPPA
jgi:hypothetical protein